MQTGDWEGFINTIKSYVGYEHRMNKKKIEEVRKQMKEDMASRMDQRMGKMKWDIHIEIRDLY